MLIRIFGFIFVSAFLTPFAHGVIVKYPLSIHVEQGPGNWNDKKSEILTIDLPGDETYRYLTQYEKVTTRGARRTDWDFTIRFIPNQENVKKVEVDYFCKRSEGSVFVGPICLGGPTNSIDLEFEFYFSTISKNQYLETLTAWTNGVLDLDTKVDSMRTSLQKYIHSFDNEATLERTHLAAYGYSLRQRFLKECQHLRTGLDQLQSETAQFPEIHKEILDLRSRIDTSLAGFSQRFTDYAELYQLSLTELLETPPDPNFQEPGGNIDYFVKSIWRQYCKRELNLADPSDSKWFNDLCFWGRGNDRKKLREEVKNGIEAVIVDVFEEYHNRIPPKEVLDYWIPRAREHLLLTLIQRLQETVDSPKPLSTSEIQMNLHMLIARDCLTATRGCADNASMLHLVGEIRQVIRDYLEDVIPTLRVESQFKDTQAKPMLPKLTLPPELFPRPDPSAIIPLAHNDPRVTPQFAAQGTMYRAVGLIWSGIPSQAMKRDKAVQFCQSLGGGARLPTVEEWEAVTRVMNGNLESLPGSSDKYFWSSGAANAFNFRSGGIPYTRDCRDDLFSVRCVVPAQ